MACTIFYSLRGNRYAKISKVDYDILCSVCMGRISNLQDGERLSWEFVLRIIVHSVKSSVYSVIELDGLSLRDERSGGAITIGNYWNSTLNNNRRYGVAGTSCVLRSLLPISGTRFHKTRRVVGRRCAAFVPAGTLLRPGDGTPRLLRWIPKGLQRVSAWSTRGFGELGSLLPTYVWNPVEVNAAVAGVGGTNLLRPFSKSWANFALLFIGRFELYWVNHLTNK